MSKQQHTQGTLYITITLFLFRTEFRDFPAPEWFAAKPTQAWSGLSRTEHTLLSSSVVSRSSIHRQNNSGAGSQPSWLEAYPCIVLVRDDRTSLTLTLTRGAIWPILPWSTKKTVPPVITCIQCSPTGCPRGEEVRSMPDGEPSLEPTYLRGW